jgi:tetratricopeptide (TPR) repeat protein
MKKIFLTLSFGSIVAFSSLAQKKNVTDAAMIMNKYNPMMGLEPAKKSVNEAKGFIDLAAANPETAEDMKMHLYRGMVYYALIEVAGMEAMTGKTPDTAAMRTYEEISKASFKKVLNDPKKSKTSDAKDFINMRIDMFFNMGVQSYNSKNFEQATQVFLGAYTVNKFIDEDCATEKCKDAYSNTTLSLNYSCDSLIGVKQFDKATELAKAVLEEMPNNIDVFITLININLQKGDAISAEKYLNKALAIDPMNKQLYYVLGTSYIDLKQNEKAEESLKKALEIDPNYSEAQYQLGAHLVNWAGDLQTQAGELNYKDPRVAELDKKAGEILLRGSQVLEKYVEKNPNDKTVLEILYKTYYRLGDTEKAAQFKKRADAIK